MARRWKRVRFSIFLCFFLRMRFRRFLMSDPMRGARLATAAPMFQGESSPSTSFAPKRSSNGQVEREVVMSPHSIRTLRHLEGLHVAVALCDGSRLDDCELVSAARRGSATLWLVDGDADRFVPLDDVVEVWETA